MSNRADQSPGRPRTKPYVIVIFGRTGVGISSLVNLITGYPASKEHPNAKTRTSRIKPYAASFPNSHKQFLLYELPGFGGPIPDATILKTIHQIERDVGIDLFIHCFRKLKTTVLPNIVRLIRDSAPAPMIAVVTELERFEPEMEWWDAVLDDDAKFTNGTKVERMCFGEDDGDGRYNAHACITTLPRDEADLIEKLRKRRDRSEDRIRSLIREHCRGPKRGE